MPLLIIDALNTIRRIHEAVPGLDCEEKVADTLKSSMASFRRALTTLSPTHAVAVFDPGGRTWKHALYAHYQANRKPMPTQKNSHIEELLPHRWQPQKP